MYIMLNSASQVSRFSEILGEMGDILGTIVMLIGAGLFIFGAISFFEAKAKEDTSRQNSAGSMIFGGIGIVILGGILGGSFANWVTQLIGA